jgi:hydroxypyruvate reductase
MKPDVLVVAPVPFVMDQAEARFALHRWDQAADRDALVAEAGPKIRGVLTTGFHGMTAALMDRLPALEIVACMAVGVDAVDVPHAKARGIVVTNTPDVLNDCVADTALGAILSIQRRLPQADRYVREGRWLKGPMPLARSLKGKKLGILGLGRIGLGIAKRAEPFGLEIAYCNRAQRADVPYRHVAGPVELARWADILVVITPGGAATRNLVGREVLDALGPEGTLVNVARGSVVDEPELVKALQEGRLGAAALDVFADEPNVPEALLGMENVVLFPHIGSGTVETRRAMAQLTVDNLTAHFEGRAPLTPV